MYPLTIVKYFNVFKHRTSCFCSCLIDLTLNTFFLQCSKEGFHERVIITVPLFAHTDLDVILVQQGHIALARVLTSSLRMMHQTSSWLPLRERHFCRFYNSLFVSLEAIDPSDTAFGRRYRHWQPRRASLLLFQFPCYRPPIWYRVHPPYNHASADVVRLGW